MASWPHFCSSRGSPPYTAGPTLNVWPWLLSALCAVFLRLVRRRLNPELVAVAWRRP